MFYSSDSCFLSKLTQNKKHFHCDVAYYGAPACSLQITVRCETHIVRHGHSNIECSQQNHPIPQCLGHTVMQQDESRLLDCCHFVLGQGRFFKYFLRERKPQLSSYLNIFKPAVRLNEQIRSFSESLLLLMCFSCESLLI